MLATIPNPWGFCSTSMGSPRQVEFEYGVTVILFGFPHEQHEPIYTQKDRTSHLLSPITNAPPGYAGWAGFGIPTGATVRIQVLGRF